MKNIIFDLGGVVVNWSPQRVLDLYPGDKNLPVWLFEKGFFHTYWTDFDRGVLSQVEVEKQMAKFSGRSYEECRGFVEFIKNSLEDLPKTVELIEKLSKEGYDLYCLSNMSNEFYDYLKVRPVFKYFKGQIISAHEKMVKPEPEIYQLILDRFDLVPQESLFIDDLKANIEAAETLGIQTVLFDDKELGYQKINQLLGL